jgi:hypothetical protein
MNAVNDVVGPAMPVRSGPETVLVPRRSFQERGTVWQGFQFKLSLS